MKDTNKRTASAVPLMYGVFLSIFLSRITWYDVRTINAARAQENDLILYFTIWSVALLPFIAVYLVKGFRLTKYYWLPTAVLGLAFYSTVTGFFFGNAANYILQDLFKFLFFPAVMYATFRLPRKFSTVGILNFVANTVFIFYGLRIMLFLLFNDTGRIYYGTAQDLFGVSFFLAILITYGKSRATLSTLSKLSLMSLLTIVGQKKTMAVGLVMVFVMAISNAFLRVNFRAIVFLTLFLIGVSAILFFLVSTSQINLKRFETANLQNELGVDSRRQMEVAVALKTLEGSELGYVFGLGGGLVLNVPKIEGGRFVASSTHSIHNTFISQLVRNGVLGVFVYGGIICYGLLWAFRNMKSNDPERAVLAKTAILYKSSAFVASFVIYGVVDDALLALLAGLILRASHTDGRATDASHRHRRIG